VITIVPPKVTEKTVEQCKILGIGKIWMQPGSESEKAIELCKKNNIELVHGLCIIVDALQKL
jgi:predicted CoA-binding protein